MGETDETAISIIPDLAIPEGLKLDFPVGRAAGVASHLTVDVAWMAHHLGHALLEMPQDAQEGLCIEVRRMGDADEMIGRLNARCSEVGADVATQRPNHGPFRHGSPATATMGAVPQACVAFAGKADLIDTEPAGDRDQRPHNPGQAMNMLVCIQMRRVQAGIENLANLIAELSRDVLDGDPAEDAAGRQLSSRGQKAAPSIDECRNAGRIGNRSTP